MKNLHVMATVATHLLAHRQVREAGRLAAIGLVSDNGRQHATTVANPRAAVTRAAYVARGNRTCRTGIASPQE
jgi:hypothetical protein